MKERVDSVFLSQLADDFLEIAKKFNDYRFEKISQQVISQVTFVEMGKEANRLMDTAREMKLLSTLIVEEEAAEALNQLQSINLEIKQTIATLKNVQTAFDLIGTLGELAMAMVEKKPSAIAEKIRALMDLLSEKTD
ncbi:hypothetical protein SAMN05192553_101356 [Cyclobacterium xiamenense]|uniref:Uncharacterized protein n=1 Tax=Cyclobacterium xiamenense TaxID=1297121 RepID=A0A1H6TXB1_9BACT|nr:hypothetical protein [Cyclobacterium xiamenense]SEI80392.1 hypothetical protein SAMN05192553_101356 [Cyclobacterium xiamenense]